jgi:hypothetical protein
VVQWIATEKARASIIPETFWNFSLAGGVLLFAYALYRIDPVFIIGQATGLVIYSRNIYFTWQAETKSGQRGVASRQTTVPTMAPIPAVSAIASAPQKVTRIIGLKTSAPPVLAPSKPSRAKEANDPTETTGIIKLEGERSTRVSGAAAPAENVAADVRAACTGRPEVISEMPSSSRAWAPSASLAISCRAT